MNHLILFNTVIIGFRSALPPWTIPLPECLGLKYLSTMLAFPLLHGLLITDMGIVGYGPFG